MTDEDFLKALVPEINPDQSSLKVLDAYRKVVAQRMEVNILKGSGNIQPVGMVSSRAKGRMLTLTKIAPGEEPVQIIGFDPAVGRDKSVVMMSGGLRIGKTTILEKMGYLSENGEGE